VGRLTVTDVEAAHWPQLEAPEIVNGMIDQFLGDVEVKREPDRLEL
jgi:hypothetical protein